MRDAADGGQGGRGDDEAEAGQLDEVGIKLGSGLNGGKADEFVVNSLELVVHMVQCRQVLARAEVSTQGRLTRRGLEVGERRGKGGITFRRSWCTRVRLSLKHRGKTHPQSIARNG